MDELSAAWIAHLEAEHVTPNTYGTLAYQATHDLLAVGRQMGHSSPVTTAIYAAPSDDAADVIAEAVAR